MYECTLLMYDSHNDYAKNNDMHINLSLFCRRLSLCGIGAGAGARAGIEIERF